MQIKFFKKEKKLKKDDLQINPDLYWNIILGLFFIAFIAISIFGYLFFETVNSPFVYENPNPIVQVETVKKGRLDKVLNYFTDREKKSADILNGVPPFIDPSR